MDAIERLIFTAAAAVIVGAKEAISSFPSSRYVSFMPQVDRFSMWWYSNGAVRKACHGIFGPRSGSELSRKFWSGGPKLPVKMVRPD